MLLEMNEQAGGNSRWGENEITAYPWAAHYVPVPGPKATYVRELFEEVGVLKNGEWEEQFLCFTPQERLFLYGRWQEGIEPAIGLSTERSRAVPAVWKTRIHKFRASGKFTIPMERGLSSGTAPIWIGFRSATGCAKPAYGFEDFELVHELLLPRRLRRAWRRTHRRGRASIISRRANRKRRAR